jgi:hypothetical protein
MQNGRGSAYVGPEVAIGSAFIASTRRPGGWTRRRPVRR